MTNGFICNVGRMTATRNPPLVDPATTNYVAAVVAAGGTVSAPRQSLIDAFIVAERANGTWDLTDDYWQLCAENTQQALLSLKQRVTATPVNSPVFTVDSGYAFDGVTNYIDTAWIPSTNAIVMSTNMSRVGTYERTDATGNNYSCGSLSSGGRSIRVRPRNATVTSSDANATAASYTLPTVDSRGFTVVSRATADNTTAFAFKNGVSMTRTVDYTVFGTTLPLLSFFIGGGNNGTLNLPRAATEGFMVVGAPLSGAQEVSQYNNIQTWMTAIGANV